MLLTDRRSVFKKFYRAPIDWLEEHTTGMADCILVNSQFTGTALALSLRYKLCNVVTTKSHNLRILTVKKPDA